MDMKLNKYYFELDQGCGITLATTLRVAQRELLKEHGTHHFRSVTPATKEQIAWVKSMGGYVGPEGE